MTGDSIQSIIAMIRSYIYHGDRMKIKTLYRILLLTLILYLIIVLISSFSNVAVHTSAQAKAESPLIIIDAGHGGEDGGAQADGVLEKDINLQIADKLADMLRLSGCRVEEIRNTDISVYDENADTLRKKKVSDLKNRVEIFNSNKNNTVVSIHQNKFENSAYNGTQIFYSVHDPKSAVLAEAIRKSVTSLLQNDNTRELKPAGSDIYILDKAQVGAVIVECGFLSNPEERAKLTDNKYQSEMAYSIAMGVLEYLKTTM